MGFRRRGPSSLHMEVTTTATYTDNNGFPITPQDVDNMVAYIYERMPESMKHEDNTLEFNVIEYLNYLKTNA